MAANKFLSDRESDTIAEITRLIAEADRYGEGAAPDIRSRQETSSEGDDDLTAPQWAGDDVEADGADHSHRDYHKIKVPRAAALVVAIVGLALLGTAGAFGCRQLFRDSVVATLPPIIRASNEPNKIAPVSAEPAANGKDTTGSIEKLVSREEQPLPIEPPKGTRRRSSVNTPAVPPPATAGQPVATQVMPLAVADPSKSPLNAVASQHALQSGAAGGTAEANSAHLATAPVSAAETQPSVQVDGYAVQVTSERSESAAQAAYRTLQAKYPNQLGGRQPMIRRADLGTPGTHYRVLVGSFASAEKAAKLCRALKTAGGDCIVQKN